MRRRRAGVRAALSASQPSRPSRCSASMITESRIGIRCGRFRARSLLALVVPTPGILTRRVQSRHAAEFLANCSSVAAHSGTSEGMSVSNVLHSSRSRSSKTTWGPKRTSSSEAAARSPTVKARTLLVGAHRSSGLRTGHLWRWGKTSPLRCSRHRRSGLHHRPESCRSQPEPSLPVEVSASWSQHLLVRGARGPVVEREPRRARRFPGRHSRCLEGRDGVSRRKDAV